MGNTKWRSNLKPQSTTPNILGWSKIQGTKVVSASVTATNIRGGTKVAGAVVNPTSYLKLGTTQYIFWGTKQTGASIIAAATKLAGATIAGSLYLSSGGKPGAFIIKSTSVASRLEGF